MMEYGCLCKWGFDHVLSNNMWVNDQSIYQNIIVIGGNYQFRWFDCWVDTKMMPLPFGLVWIYLFVYFDYCIIQRIVGIVDY